MINLASYMVNGSIVKTSSGDVYDKSTKQFLSTFIANINTWKATVDTFLTGQADDPVGTMDKLSELVAQIAANKDSITSITSGKVNVTDIVNDLTTGGTTKVLSAEQGKTLKGLIDAIHVFTNQTVRDAISADATSGNLVFNGVELGKFTGIAVGASSAAATDYSSKVQVILEEFDETA